MTILYFFLEKDVGSVLCHTISYCCQVICGSLYNIYSFKTNNFTRLCLTEQIIKIVVDIGKYSIIAFTGKTSTMKNYTTKNIYKT